MRFSGRVDAEKAHSEHGFGLVRGRFLLTRPATAVYSTVRVSMHRS